ncbi:MAG: M4 family metallopeptidase, partial [Gammaproteobacteria bacterium]|nr:M4 family metallopeptidase [Gammaproteobacteria bacterium]
MNRRLLRLSIFYAMILAAILLGVPAWHAMQYSSAAESPPEHSPLRTCPDGTKPKKGLCVSAASTAKKKSPADAISIKPLPKKKTTQQAPSPSADVSADKIAERLRNALGNLTAKTQAKKMRRKKPKPREADPLAGLRKRTGNNLDIRRNPKTGTPAQIKGGILEPAAKGRHASRKQREKTTAENFLRKNRTVLGIKNPQQELELARHSKPDTLGHRHLRFAQRYQGIPVWPAELTVHLDAKGNVILMNGAYVPTPHKPFPRMPPITEGEAINHALTALANPAQAVPAKPELIVYAPGDKTPRLAWKLTVSVSLTVNWLVVIDASTGGVLTRYNQIHEGRASGSGHDLFNTLRALRLWEEGGVYYMVDTGKAMFNPRSSPPDPQTTRGGILVFDMQNRTAHPQAHSPAFLAASTSPVTGFLPDAVSATFALSEAYDYFWERHGRNAIDGQGRSLSAVVRAGKNLHNAFWIPNKNAMYFGDGQPYAGALDVVGHEMAHGITQNTAGLIYQDQPGALNEAFSDIFGEMIEARTHGRPDWLTGTKLRAPLRNMKNPAALAIGGLNRPYPARMSEFVHTTKDRGGVHLNSSIINHAYYLLAEGLNDALGLAEAEKIFYRALAVHLSKNSRFVDARLAAVTSAEELFGSRSAQAAKTAEAFDAVEIFGYSPPAPSPAPSPPPGPVPPRSKDGLLFVCMNHRAGEFFLCRREEALGDGKQGVILSQSAVTHTRLSVSKDGQLASFVDTARAMCLINTDGQTGEVCLQFPEPVHSAALSPDAQRYAIAFVNDKGNAAAG